MTESLEARVFRTLAAVLSVPAAKIDRSSSPDNVAGWDSLKQMSLVLALEEEFSIRFSEDEMLELSDAARILEIVGRRAGSR